MPGTAVHDQVRIMAGFCTDRIGTVVNVHPSGSADVRVVHPMWFCDPSSPLTTSVLCYAPAEFVPADLPGGEDYIPTPPVFVHRDPNKTPGGADERPSPAPPAHQERSGAWTTCPDAAGDGTAIVRWVDPVEGVGAWCGCCCGWMIGARHE